MDKSGEGGRILLLEDDESLVDGLEYILQKNGFDVAAAGTVGEALRLLEEEEYDLLILDVMLPDGSGYQVCAKLRETSLAPVLFLTAVDEEVSVVKGLDMGGDDYLTKPFRLNELISRIRALLRRSGAYAGKSGNNGRERLRLCSGGIEIDLKEHRAYREGEALDLTFMEFRLLSYLLENKGRILTRGQILERLWDGEGSYVDDNTLSVYIKRLREKIEDDPAHPRRLVTARGFGYSLREPEDGRK